MHPLSSVIYLLGSGHVLSPNGPLAVAYLPQKLVKGTVYLILHIHLKSKGILQSSYGLLTRKGVLPVSLELRSPWA